MPKQIFLCSIQQRQALSGALCMCVLVIVPKLEELLSLSLLTWPSISAACCNSQHHCRHGYNTALPHKPGRLYLPETDVCFLFPTERFTSESFPNSCPPFVDISFIYHQWNQGRVVMPEKRNKYRMRRKSITGWYSIYPQILIHIWIHPNL